MSAGNLLLSGEGISEGMALGKAFLYEDILQRDHKRYDVGPDQLQSEFTRIQRAIREVLEDLDESAQRVENELCQELSNIFRSHQMLLADPEVGRAIEEQLIEQRVNAEEVIKRVFYELALRFRGMTHEQFRDRGDDVEDIARRLLSVLAGVQAHPLTRVPQYGILVANRLLPSDTVHLSGRSIVGLVLAFGGPASHAALLAREMGIPAVAQLDEPMKKIVPEDFVLVDGSLGQVLVRPDEHHKGFLEARLRTHHESGRSHPVLCQQAVRTRDGIQIQVMANISTREDALLARENGADGIGLYRTEHLYLSRRHLPSEEELWTILKDTLEPACGKPVTVRLLDAGGDKRIPCVDQPDEPNPFLGVRGVRLLLRYPELLGSQIRALVRLSSEHEIRILVPLVTMSKEIIQVRRALKEAVTEMGLRSWPPLGAMIETPAAALCVADIARHVDFMSIGTNDLTQYTMVAGREDPLVSDYFLDDHPAVIRLVQLVCQESGDTPVSVCGELAGRGESLGTLLSKGVRTLSVAAPLVSSVKQRIQKLTVDRNEDDESTLLKVTSSNHGLSYFRKHTDRG
jgi:phosphotransferase system enzyme I (PtsI)